MRGILLGLAMLAFCGPAWAREPHVGKRDNTAGPTLPAVATPAAVTVKEEPLAPDTHLAATLEKADESSLAALEWQRIAEGSTGVGRREALAHAAENYERAGLKDSAARVLRLAAGETFGAEKAVLLYRLSRVARPEDLAAVLHDLREIGGPWSEAALYQAVWRQAQAGPVRETYGLYRAGLLQQRLRETDHMLAQRAATAAVLGMVPGLGHAYLGHAASAAGLLAIWSLCGWLFLWCWRRRWWPFMVLWALPLGLLWGTSPGMAGTVADQDNAKLRRQLLAGWRDLQPVEPHPAFFIRKAD
jgi:hypothetical protein